MRAFFREESCNQRIRHRLKHTVRCSKNKHPPEKEFVNRGPTHFRIGHKSHESRQHVQSKRRNHQLAVAQFIDQKTANDDTKAKASETCASNRAQLRAGEAVLATPSSENTATNGEAHAGGQNSHKTSPQ